MMEHDLPDDHDKSVPTHGCARPRTAAAWIAHISHAARARSPKTRDRDASRRTSTGARVGIEPSRRAGPPRPLAALLLGLSVATAAVAQADEEPLPSPLTLEHALTLADDHPRIRAAAQAATGKTESIAALLPRPQPLFLGCHALAFTGTRGDDAARDVAWSALLTSEASQRLEIMQRFYDVLLADLSYSRDNEAMAVAFIQFDRAEARAELGQFSPLKVAELEAEYQLIRRQRAASEAAQRITRSLLAQALGRPEELPRDLVTPDLAADKTKLPELDAVVGAALENNPRVKALVGSSDAAGRALVEMSVRQQALELLTRMELLDVIAEQAETESYWRDLKLDESRTMYELEVTADLGFSMSQQTKAKRDEEQVALCLALTRAELAALQGKSVP